MLPLLIFIVIGKVPLLVICMVISVMALYEYFKGFENLEIKASKPVAFALVLALYAAVFASVYYLKDYEIFEHFLDMWVFAAVACCLLLAVLDKDHNILGPTYTMIGLLYIPFMFLHVALLEERIHALAWLPCIIGSLSDIGGYLGGIYFGKHRLVPTLSPKKTVEGAVAGIIFGTLSAVLFAIFFYRAHIIFCLIMGAAGSLIAELGDLTASTFKRKMGIKDYSNLIPGHGGILDRFDSLIFVAPFVYYSALLFIK